MSEVEYFNLKLLKYNYTWGNPINVLMGKILIVIVRNIIVELVVVDVTFHRFKIAPFENASRVMGWNFQTLPITLAANQTYCIKWENVAGQHVDIVLHRAGRLVQNGLPGLFVPHFRPRLERFVWSPDSVLINYYADLISSRVSGREWMIQGSCF